MSDTLSVRLLFVIIAISAVSAIGGLVFNTMPLLLESLKTSGLDAKALGQLTWFAGGGYLAGTLTTPLWSERVNWKLASITIVGLTIAACMFAANVPPDLLWLALTVFGFCCALAVALAMRILADMPQPERAFGTRLAVELISIGAFMIVLPVVFIAKGGFSGAMTGLAIFTLILGIGAFFIPKRPETDTDSASTFPAWRTTQYGWTALGVFVIYLLTNVGVFWFLAVLAGKFSPTPEQFGLMFLVLKWLGGGAAITGALIGASLGHRIPHALAGAILIAGLIGLWLAPSFNVFMVASWVWEFGFTLGCLYLTATISRADESGKLVSLIPAAFGIAMLLGGLLAGYVISGAGEPALYLIVGVCSLIPTILVLRKGKIA